MASNSSSELIGRESEKEILRRAEQSKEAELIAVFGRRRVGKTFLVRQYFANQFAFQLTGTHNASRARQLRQFSAALEEVSGSNIDKIATWDDAFRSLRNYLQTIRGKKKIVVFLDELPWLSTHRSGFLSALEAFWNGWAAHQPRLLLIVCGSATSWMIRKLVYNRGGLHNRITRRISLKPFTLGETERYLTSRGIGLDRSQILELSMVMGGIPHYLKEIEPGESAAQIIDRVCFSEHGLLRDEFSNLYASLFDHAEKHIAIVRALAKKRRGLTRDELASAAKVASGGGLTKILQELSECGFVLVTWPFGKSSHDRLYRLVDEYSLFYLQWLEKLRPGQEASWLTKQNSPAWKALRGYAFEGICLKHTAQIKKALGINGIETTECSWVHRATHPNDQGAQIDLVIDRSDRCVNLCEMKFADQDFVISKAYASELRRRIEVFREITHTRKTLFLSLIVSPGLKSNTHSVGLVSNQIDANALF